MIIVFSYIGPESVEDDGVVVRLVRLGSLLLMVMVYERASRWQH